MTRKGSVGLVVLSGGMDSVALLHWALPKFKSVHALCFDYGQPHRDAELTAARIICERRGVDSTTLHIGEAVRGLMSLGVPEPGFKRGQPRVSTANLPARNAIFGSCAAAFAGRTYPGDRVSVLLGCNLDDVRGFPDCRPDFITALSRALSEANAGVCNVRVEAPWLPVSKHAIVMWAKHDPEIMRDVRDSISCYAGTRCGVCSACILRAAAFEACGEEDGQWLPTMHGAERKPCEPM